MLLRILLAGSACYLLVCLLAFLGQRRLLYFPGPPPDGTPAGLGASWRDVTLVTEDGERLGAWWIEAPDARGAVLVSHGNAGSIENRLSLARTFLSMGCSVLLYDYRGYGTSTGSPDEHGTYRDGRAAYAWLRNEGWEARRILFYGESLGGGVALQLATELPAAGIVIESTFTSIPDLGAEVYRWLPVRWLARDRYDNLSKIGRLDGPVLIVHSPEDDLVPFSHAERLQKAAPRGTRLLATYGGHNDGGFAGRSELVLGVERFVARALGEGSGEDSASENAGER